MATNEESLGSENGWHRVCLNTIVRKGEELDSERLRILPMGSRVFVEEVIGRRVRISSPIAGWCSKKSSTMDTILEKIDTSNMEKDGGITPSNRNPQHKIGILKTKIEEEEDVSKLNKLKRELADLKNVLEKKEEAQRELETRFDDVNSRLIKSSALQTHIRVSDCVKLPRGKGLGIVKWTGSLPETPDVVTIGVQVEMGHGDSNGFPVEDDPTVGWQAGDLGAIFCAESEVKLLTGESMLSELVNLIALKTHIDTYLDKLGDGEREKFYKELNKVNDMKE